MSTETNELGRYVFEDLAADEYRLFAHSAALGAFFALDKRVRVELGASSQADIDLRFAARISGTVVDARSSPVAGAFVAFQSTTTEDLTRCTTDASGRFDCTSMTGGGTYRAEVRGSEASPKPYAFVGGAPEPILLRDGDAHLEDVRLVVDASSLTIKGVVVDRAGQPLPDVRVAHDASEDTWAAVSTAVTNLRGEFELRDLSPGSYALRALGADGGRALVDGVAAGTADVRLLLDPPSCEDTNGSQLGQVLHEVPGSISNRPSARVAWEESVELLGWACPVRVRVGEPFQITLYYKVLKPLDRSWKIFMHMDGPMRRINADHDPLRGRCPTSTWTPGDVVVDRTPRTIDPSFDSGAYDVWIGFFGGMAPNWKNLSLSDAPLTLRDEYQRFKLTSIEVAK